MNFFSNGKLLISGEYLVMKGATALTVPLMKGQSLHVEAANEPGVLQWVSHLHGRKWFGFSLNLKLFEILDTTDLKVAKNLVKILKAAQKLNPGFLSGDKGFHVTTHLDFILEWGFGSSSSLISNIAFWAGVDPFELHLETSEGSGYDVVAARKTKPFFFTLKKDGYRDEDVDFKPEFRNRLFFVYLGTKQDSAASVKHFLEKDENFSTETERISELSKKLTEASSLKEFEKYLAEHNRIISSVLSKPTLKETRFNDLDGEIKPLGAWGGDFALMTWNGDPGKIRSYLELKDIHDFFTFNELVKQSES